MQFVEKLKITIIGLHYAPEPSGNAPYTTGLAEGLAARGHEVRVLTGYPHYPEWKVHQGYDGWTRVDFRNGVRLKRLRHFVPRRPSALSRIHMELSFGARVFFARWGSPDVVILVTPALFSTALAALRSNLSLKRPALAIWIQDLYSRGLVETSQASGLTSKLAARIESKILGSAHQLVVIHDRFKTHLVEAFKFHSSSISVIRNWTHLPPAPAEGQSDFRKRMGWHDEDFVVLHAGNMGKKQGLENVVDAAREAQSRGSNVKFVLMGDGNQRSRLQAAAQGISHLSFVDSLPDADFELALTSADALLVNELPGVKDMSVPSKLTSYFNAGKPIIAATDGGSVTSLEIAASHGGVRVDAADPSSLVSVAEALRDDPSRSKELGIKGLQYRYETLSESAALGQYDDFIMSLATSRGR